MRRMLFLIAVLLSTFPLIHGFAETSMKLKKGTTLYVWAGDQARVAPDFVAAIDFDESSKTYGKVIRTAPVPTSVPSSGNEAHHMHLSADGSVLACGGLLSLLKGQDQIFFFDVTDARNPKYIKST